MSNLTDIHDLVAATITADISLGLTATAVFLPVYELPETISQICVVLPKRATMTRDSRSTESQQYSYDVALLKKVTDPDTEIPDLLDTLEKIHRLFRSTRTLTGSSATYFACSQSPIYDPQRLEKDKLFLGLMTLTFRLSD